MAHLSLTVICFILVIAGSYADVEYDKHGHIHHHHDHDGHDHHDHESHKKLFAGDELDGDENEKREKLLIIAKKIDTNHDEQISRDEMRTYIEQRIKEQNMREADDLIATLDPTHTKKVTFDAYIRDNFGDLDMNEIEKSTPKDLSARETRRMYIVDKGKWTYLDKDGDSALSYDEFRRFLRPEDDEALRKIEIDSIIKEYDENNDGKISNDEYMKLTEAEAGQADSLGEDIDTNKDGFGDHDEFTRYYLPTLSSTLDEETDHLLKECDVDHDGYCSPNEIAQAYSSFAGSQITDYGADLETYKEDL